MLIHQPSLKSLMTTITTLHQGAIAALSAKNYQQAHHLIMHILQQDKYFADGYFLLGVIAHEHGNLTKALELYQQAITLAPDNQEYLVALAKLYAQNHQYFLADNTLNSLNLTADTTTALMLDTIAVTYSQLGKHQYAHDYFVQATALAPENSQYQFNLAANEKFLGHSEKAYQAYQHAITLQPTFYKAYFGRSSVFSASTSCNHIEELKTIFNTLTAPNDKLQIGHALAKEYEQLGDYQLSFESLEAAKKAKLASLTYQLNDDRRLFSALTEHFSHSQEQIKQQKSISQDNTNDDAIFVVGMPRTGTTLVERILTNHSKVTSAGELQNFGLLFKQFSQSQSNRVLDETTIAASSNINFAELGQAYLKSTRHLVKGKQKFVDKMPFNVLYTGFILQALPNAKIICLDRNPLDTILSNFKQLFSVDQSYYHYAYDLTWCCEFYLLFRELIHFWQQQYPDNFYLLNYEKLVTAPQAEAKKLFQFVGLDWQAHYINIANNKNPVATASSLQVRSTISKKFIGQWQHYEKQLAPAINLLKNNKIEY